MSEGDFRPLRPVSLSIPTGPYTPRRPTLEEVLSNTATPPWTLSAFMLYLSQNHCLETLEFTMDANRYAKHYQDMIDRNPHTPLSPRTEDCERVRMLWQKLLDAYIAPNGPREVNLPSDIRDHLLSLPCAGTPPDPAELEPVVKIIYELMDESVLVPFLNSVAPSRGPESVISPWTSNESMTGIYMTGSLDERSLSPGKSPNQRNGSPSSSGIGTGIVPQYWGPTPPQSSQSHLGLSSRLPANISESSGNSSAEAPEMMTDNSTDSAGTTPNTPPASNAAFVDVSLGTSPQTHRSSSWKKMDNRLPWKKSRSGRGSGSSTSTSQYPMGRKGIIAPMEHPIARHSSHRQEHKKTAFVHGGTSLRLSESGESPVLEAHPGLPVEITSRRPSLPTSATAQRLYHGRDEELLKFEKSKLGEIEEGGEKDGMAAKVQEHREYSHAPLIARASVSGGEKSMANSSVESTAMDFDFETDNGVWISAHPVAHESRTSLSAMTTTTSTLMDDRYSHGTPTVDTSVASSAASTQSATSQFNKSCQRLAYYFRPGYFSSFVE